MESVFFAKYSYERDPRFRVMTRIVGLENGNREVQKIADDQNSVQHVADICNAYEALRQYHCNDAICIVPCEMRGEMAVFPYVSGDLLTDRIYDLMRLHDTDALIALLKEYVQRITAGVELVPFQKTEQFCQIFGDKFELEGIPAFQPCDVDMIPSNIIISDDKWYVFDYEWTFNFPIPVDYIIYRAILFCVIRFNITKEIPEGQIYESLGLDLTRKAYYEAMENAFQKYVYGQAIDYPAFYENMRKPVISLFNIDILNDMPMEGGELREILDALALADARQKDAIARLNAEGDALRIKIDEMTLSEARKDYWIARLNAEGDELRVIVDQNARDEQELRRKADMLREEADETRRKYDLLVSMYEDVLEKKEKMERHWLWKLIHPFH